VTCLPFLKLKLAQKGRIFHDINKTEEWLHAAFAESEQRTLTNDSNNSAVNVITLSSCMGSTLQGQHGIAGKCCYHWERNIVRKLYYHPLYVQGVTESSSLGTS